MYLSLCTVHGVLILVHGLCFINEVYSFSLLRYVGVEFRGSAGVAAGYVRGTDIVGNEVGWVPNTAVSLGWGWGRGPNGTRLETMAGE